MNIGIRLRRIRRIQGRTLQQVADQAKITKSLLSKIENGSSMPPIATLTRIAKALGVDIAALLSNSKQEGAIYIAASDTSKTTLTNKGYDFFSFANERPDKLMHVYLFTAKKGQVKRQALSHRGEEFIYILKGRTRYTVGNTQYTLKAGDALYFDSEEDHDLDPISDNLKYLAVFCDRAKK